MDLQNVSLIAQGLLMDGLVRVEVIPHLQIAKLYVMTEY